MARPFASTANASESERLVARLIYALNSEAKTTKLLSRYSGSDVLTRQLKEYCDAYPGFRVHPLDIFSERDLVVVAFVLELDAGTLAWQAGADRQPELFEAIAVCRVENGLIADLWLEIDVFTQLYGNGEHAAGSAHAALSRVGNGRSRYSREVAAAELVLIGNGASSQTETSRALVLRYLAASSGAPKTPELLQRFVTDTTLIERVLAFEVAFPCFELRADAVVAAGDRVAVRFHTWQRHTQEFLGIPATGRELTISGAAIFRVANGKIVEHWQQMATWTLLRAIQTGRPNWQVRQVRDRRAMGERRRTPRPA